MFVAAPGTSPTEEELRAYGRRHLEAYKVPERVHLVAELPLGRTGKTDRTAAARLAAAVPARTGADQAGAEQAAADQAMPARPTAARTGADR